MTDSLLDFKDIVLQRTCACLVNVLLKSRKPSCSFRALMGLVASLDVFWWATQRMCRPPLADLSGLPVVEKQDLASSGSAVGFEPTPWRTDALSQRLVVAYIASVCQEPYREIVLQTLALIQGPPPETGAHALCQACASSTLLYSDPLLPLRVSNA